ncbi:MAG: ArsR family transcriptional regulator [Promethearchaeota archaeon]
MISFGNTFRIPLLNIAEDLLPIVKSIAHKNRMQILIKLLEGSTTFQSLLRETGLQKASLAHHLQNLLNSSLINKPDYGTYDLSNEGRAYLLALYNTFEISSAAKKLKTIQSTPMSEDFFDTTIMRKPK